MRVSKAQARALLPHVYAALELYRKSDAGTRKAFELLAQVRERHDGNFEDVFRGWLGDVQAALRDLVGSDRADFEKAIQDAFNTDTLLRDYQGTVETFLADYEKTFDKELTIKADWTKANDSAVSSLGNAVDTYFTKFADEQRDRIQGILEDGLSNGDPTKKIAGDLAAGMDNVEYVDEDGNVYRTLTADQWATVVARTESNRAYVEATREALTSAGLETWQWIAANDERTDDECAMNDGEIVAIGEDFPSGDTEPPVHANCRCVVTAVESELLGTDKTDNQSDEESD